MFRFVEEREVEGREECGNGGRVWSTYMGQSPHTCRCASARGKADCGRADE
jgi:hypothetical protein